MKLRKLRNDLTGKKFNHLLVLRRSDDRGYGKKPVVKWDCLCDCGKRAVIKSDSLLSGHTKSCGCRKVKHGFSNKERLYDTWKNMRRRCSDPNNKRWLQYGGRGISICEEWDDYKVFREWAMNNGYTDELTIDRMDVDGNYNPDNCRWATEKVQANNTSRNRYFEYQGEKFSMSELADLLGITYATLQHRVEREQNIFGAKAL